MNQHSNISLHFKRKTTWQYRQLAMLLVVFLFTQVAGTFSARAYDLTEMKERHAAADQLNQLRQTMGIRTAALSSKLNEAAQNHCLYMNKYQQCGMTERRGEGFTGVLPINRAQYVGFGGNVLEIDAEETEKLTEMMTAALQNPHTRYHLLNPYFDQIGFGVENGYAQIMLGNLNSKIEDQRIIYPYPGAQAVGNVSIESLPELEVDTLADSVHGMIGLPVTVACYTQEQDISFDKVLVSMWDTRLNLEVPCQVDIEERAGENMNMLTIYPLRAYNADTRYEVEVSFTVLHGTQEKERINEIWSFTSSGPDAIGEVSRLEALIELCDLFEFDGGNESYLEMEGFTDYPYVSTDVEHRKVYGLIHQGVLTSWSDGAVLHPDDGITRAQAAAWMVRMVCVFSPEFYYSVRLSFEDTFKDINSCPYQIRGLVQRAYQLGIIDDQGGGMFSPTVYITRNEWNNWLQTMRQLLESS